jgi:hypothetical protein
MLSLLLAVSLALPQPKIEVPVTLSQFDDPEWWGVQAVGHGVVSQPDISNLEVTLSELSLRANPKYGKDRAVLEVKACLARPTEKGWKPVACSPEHRIAALIKSGESLTMQDLVFSIPVPKGSPIASYFLALTIEAPGVVGAQSSWHAFSEGDPLQELQDLIAAQTAMD